MRYVGWMALVLWLALLGAGCVSTSTLVPAHLERYYAGFSAPSFSADGSICVLNGDVLLHYSAAGARLSATTLPDSLRGSGSASMYWPDAIPLRDGELAVFTNGSRLGRLGRDGQLRWQTDVSWQSGIPRAFRDGVLINRAAGDNYALAYLDRNGLIAWSVPGLGLQLKDILVDEYDRINTINSWTSEFVLLDADGAELLRRVMPWGWLLLAAGHERLVFGTPEGAVCWDSAGNALWSFSSAAETAIGQAQVLGPDCIALVSNRYFDDGLGHIDGLPSKQTLLLVDGAGTPTASSREYDSLTLCPGSGAGVVAETAAGNRRAWTRFGLDAAPLWSYALPVEAAPAVAEGATVARHDWTSRIMHHSDGRSYCDSLSTFHALDAQGRVLWQVAGEAYHERWVEVSFF